MDLARRTFEHNGLTFSYLDSGGPGHDSGRPLIALHAHLMEAVTYAPLAEALGPGWRVVALDQRGHGHSSHAPSYTRADYLGDLEALYAHLGIGRAVVLGNSLGGINAIEFAARHPERVEALVIEDIGAVVKDDISFVLPWAGFFLTREALAARVGERFAPYFADSMRETPAGWRLAFEPAEMVESQKHVVGDYWADWLKSKCPALLLRGRDSRVTSAELCEEMYKRRPNTTLITLDGGHALHVDTPMAFNLTVCAFLESIEDVA